MWELVNSFSDGLKWGGDVHARQTFSLANCV